MNDTIKIRQDYAANQILILNSKGVDMGKDYIASTINGYNLFRENPVKIVKGNAINRKIEADALRPVLASQKN